MARIIDTSEDDLMGLSGDEAHWVYNGFDCCVTEEVYRNLRPMMDNVALATYEFSKALQAPVAEMSLRGMLVNQNRKHKVLTEFRKASDQLQEQFNTLVEEGVGVSASWSSPHQVKQLLYDVMGLPVQRKQNANGVYAPTTNRDALEHLASYYFIAQPIVSHILALRDLQKSIGFLETGIDSDGRMRTSINIAGTNTGRWSSQESDFGTGCVRPTAEALTPLGWKALNELKDGDLIAQVEKGWVSFVPATFYWTEFEGDLLRYKTEQVDLTITPNHRVLSYDYKDNVSVFPAHEAMTRKQQRIPLSGISAEGTLEMPAYVAMLMADFSKENTVWRGAFKKQRKINRFLQLAEEYNLAYEEIKAKPGYRRFSLKDELDWPAKYDRWVLALTKDSAIALVNEARYWDGHARGNSFLFFTADKDEASWFQTLCHIAGKSATVRSQRNSDTAYGNNSIIYTVNVKPRQTAQVLSKHWSKVSYRGKVGCPTVPSSFWLVRENGFISVTGNTNLQNVTEKLRSVFVADPGYKLANLDLEQGDSRNLGALCWDLFSNQDEQMAAAYLDACESGDLHTAVARMTLKNLPWGTVPDREVADKVFYRGRTYRDMAKTLGHASNYMSTPSTAAKHSKFPLADVKAFQEAYFQRFKCIPAYHDWVAYQLEHFAQITTPFGRRRFFFDRPKEKATIREAVAFSPQSMTAEEINLGILALWRANRVQLLLQVHDSVLFQYPEEQEDEIIPWALETLKTHLTLAGGRDFYVPTEAMVGWNWGYRKEDNPDGLIKWKGGDSRKRTETNFKLSLLGA